MNERKFKHIGTRPVRPDGVDKVTGRANYGADIDMPGMLHGVVLRSPYAHARIRSIDTSAAEKSPGVKAVLVGTDLPDLPRDLKGGPENHVTLADLSRNCLARETALYHGHAVAALAATSLEAAQEAVQKIVVDYEELEPVLEIDQAIAPDAPILHDHVRTAGMRGDLPDGPTNIASRIEFSRGNLEEGFADADVVVEREFSTPWAHQGYIEPHACAARVGEDGQAVLYGSSQGQFLMRDLCVGLLQLEPGKLKVVPAEIGGGFGGKTTVYNEPLVVALAKKSNRPVKMVMTREEVFRATGPTSASKMRFKMGAKRDGTITAASASIYMEAGAFPGSPAGAAAMCCFGPYTFPNFSIEAHDVLVNKLKSAAYRAPGAPMGALGTESLLDEIAREIGMDPIELRLRNAVQQGDTSTLGMPYDRIGFIETLEAAKSHPHYKAPLGPNQGRGVASGYWFNAGMQSSANISIHADGSAVVACGSPDIGGWRASMALIAAEELGIPYERVRPVVLDTDSVGYSDLTGGSRTTVVTGMAIIEAARQVIDELRARTAKMWDVELDAVGWQDGCAVGVNGAGDNEPMTLAEIAAGFSATGGPVNAEASVVPAATGPSFGTHICDLEVDKETGVSKVVRYTVVQDAGKAIHPSYVEGQMQGGASQGIGIALNEEYIYDEKGVLENPSFLDYRMPVASDLPMIDTVIVEVPNPAHPYGARGVGEIPIVPPLAAVANAMSDALGVRMTDLPLSPPRVLGALSEDV
ncbi:MAG: xanthine dehydrogenase family protein molybdopterin-binding subunit [Myxococcales bacterium]|nr:xanthine dehydrogenase family protein molybdopterin-binding subunit [Myxococcales bacterium]